jgi:DNA-binding Xre family transcriptional regulator
MTQSKITLNSKIVNRMRIILRERGMTIKDLARETDHYYPLVVRFCSADQEAANLFIMAKVCEVLGIQPGDIFTYEANQPAPLPSLEMGEFATWLPAQADRGDPVGKLVRDILGKIKDPDPWAPLPRTRKRMGRPMSLVLVTR